MFTSNIGTRLLRITLVVFMLVAGINHFLNVDFYLPLIPEYLPYPELINSISGLLEVAFSMLLLFRPTRKFAAFGIIVLLLLFIPSHIHFIKIGACVPDGLCTPLWLAWLRLVLVHPILVLWTWYVGAH